MKITNVSFVPFTDEHVKAAATMLGEYEADIRKRLQDPNRPLLDELDRAFFKLTGVYPVRLVKP